MARLALGPWFHKNVVDPLIQILRRYSFLSHSSFFFLFNLFLERVFLSVIELEIDEILMGLCLIAHHCNSFIFIVHFPCLILVISGVTSIEFSVETAQRSFKTKNKNYNRKLISFLCILIFHVWTMINQT